MGRICCKVDGKTHKARCKDSNDLMVPWDECRTGCIEANKKFVSCLISGKIQSKLSLCEMLTCANFRCVYE